MNFLVAITLLAGGCASTARPPVRADTEEFPPTDQVTSLSLPFDAYGPSLAELYTIANAQDRLTRDCMKAAGLDWKMIARPMAVKDYRNRRRYGVIEMAIAQNYGFHVPTGLLTPSVVEDLYDARDNSLSQQQKDAAYGNAGCATNAAHRFPSNTGPESGRLAELDRRSLDESRREPSVASALTAWRECAGRQVQSYQDPFEAVADTRWWADESAVPSAEEKKVAVVDVGCKEQTGLVGAWHAAEVRTQQDLIRRNADYFQKARVALERDLAEANAILTR